MSTQEESFSSGERKIHIHLDGKDFEGFLYRMLEVVVSAVALTFMTGWDGGLIFVVITAFWSIFLLYKVIQFKESAYHQIIEDLENQNAKLEKTNKLLQNVVQDKLGMRISLEDKQ
jgi:membrane protein implicated in regulation of membrane protease activity